MNFVVVSILLFIWQFQYAYVFCVLVKYYGVLQLFTVKVLMKFNCNNNSIII